MLAILSLICASSLLAVQAIPSINGPLDVAKLKRVLDDGLKSNDIPSLYYGVRGYREVLKETVANAKEICDAGKKYNYDKLNVEHTFFMAYVANRLGCREILPPVVLKTAMGILNDEHATLIDFHNGILILRELDRNTHDLEQAKSYLSGVLKKDDSVLFLATAINICSDIGCADWSAERIEDLLIQADELDGKMLLWDGGLSITSLALTAILRVSVLTKKPTPITPEQGVKFGNYLLSRNTVQTAKGAALLLEAASALARDDTISPVSISLKGGKQISGDAEPVTVFVSDILGKPLKNMKSDTVIAQSATRLADDVVVLSKQPLIAHPTDKSLFTLDLLKVKPEKGLYKLALSAGTSKSSLTVRVLGEVTVDSVEIGINDIDGISSKKMVDVKYPNKVPQSLDADNLQRLLLKFVLKDKHSKQPTAVHQAFVRIWNKSTQDEYVIVAEQDSSKTYKMDVDVGNLAEAFDVDSGNYGIELILGDFAILNPIRWHLTDISLKFSQQLEKKGKAVSRRTAKPEIEHLFRKPEPRPARILSDAFTALCAAPFLLLLVLWFRIGVNVSNFPFTLSALTFHAGLGGILGLFVVFWLQLTMFETIRYLLGLGLLTFISGHRLLRYLVSHKKVT